MKVIFLTVYIISEGSVTNPEIKADSKMSRAVRTPARLLQLFSSVYLEMRSSSVFSLSRHVITVTGVWHGYGMD